ncbi:VOC family protein [Solitalea sp. MAHUQ-68]|uniref:VOC family protein n=1 Tax=Solitalea agri TaxID=2953739 RepID=A0A9X2F4E3_9SPHI|nr:VOC family protein [Solitalea agri]MCO4293960.1 VOC family protein [Solitalea agri]
MTTHAINWFEIPVSDFERAKKFYSHILAFDMVEMLMGTDRMGFFPSEAGSVSGAIVSGKNHHPGPTGVYIYLNCGDDMSEVLNKIPEVGGKIETPKTIINPEYGYYAFIIDSEGNKIGLHSHH